MGLQDLGGVITTLDQSPQEVVPANQNLPEPGGEAIGVVTRLEDRTDLTPAQKAAILNQRSDLTPKQKAAALVKSQEPRGDVIGILTRFEDRTDLTPEQRAEILAQREQQASS